MLEFIEKYLSFSRKITLLTNFLFFLITLFFQSCIDNEKPGSVTEEFRSETSMKKIFSFPLGIAIHGSNLNDTASKHFSEYFNSLSTANAMKFEAIHPHMDEYAWGEADSIVKFALEHKMVVRGHTLLWSNRNPYWLFWDEKGNLIHRSLLDQRLKDHIQTVVSRYKGNVYAWDVVNEAIYDNDKEFLKTNNWYKVMGADYIKKAFQYAHDADSNAILFYNDYDAERPDKLKRITKLIKWLQSEKVPIHGMGIQGHWTIDSPTVNEIRSAVETYADLGLQVQITELDIVLPPDFKGSDKEKIELLSDRYTEIFKVLYELRTKITGITFWQTTDVPMKYPPLFDDQLNPTPIYHAIRNAWSEN